MCLHDFNLHQVWDGCATPTLLTHSDLVQEHSMEKECADAWSLKQPCPDIERLFSKWTPTRHSSSFSEALLQCFNYRFAKSTMCQTWSWYQKASTRSGVGQHGLSTKHVPWKNKRSLLTCHSRRATLVDIKYMELPVIKARSRQSNIAPCISCNLQWPSQNHKQNVVVLALSVTAH
jgi:hypothetical protein